MRVGDFDYELPEEKIAKYPPIERGSTRLLVLDRHSGAIAHKTRVTAVARISA